MKNKSVILLTIIFTILISIPLSLAYWKGVIQVESESKVFDEQLLQVGTGFWQDGSFDLSEESNDIIIVGGDSDKRVIVKGIDGVDYDIKKFSSLVVFNGDIGPFIMYNPGDPDICSPWRVSSDVCLKPGVPGLQWSKAYRHNELQYFNFVFYEEGDVVLFNGELYIAGGGAPAFNSPNEGGPSEWVKIDKHTHPYDVNKPYNVGDKIVVENQNGEFLVYKAVHNGKLKNPTTEDVSGHWNYYLTMTYVHGNVYNKGEIVSYNDIFYRAVSDVPPKTPPTNNTYWIHASLPDR